MPILITRQAHVAASLTACLGLALLHAAGPAWSQIPEPDNVVYGQIAIDTNLVTAQRTNVIVEVHNTEGLVLASYRMGQDSNLGDFYAVEIPFWSPDQGINPAPPPTGELLTVLVKETTFISGRVTNLTRFQTDFVVGDRGYVERIDFGEVMPSSGFDAWAALHGLAAGSENLDADGDGFSNGQEFVAGTDPNNPNSLFAVAIDQAMGSVELSFVALQADGPGYTGLSRHYTLEAADDPGGPWLPLPNCSDVPGDNLTHVCILSVTNDQPQFYRGRVELR